MPCLWTNVPVENLTATTLKHVEIHRHGPISSVESRTIQLRIPISDEWKRKRKKSLYVAGKVLLLCGLIIMAIAFVAFCLTPDAKVIPRNHPRVIVPPLAIALGLVLTIIGAAWPSIKGRPGEIDEFVAYIDEPYVSIREVNNDFLSSLPTWQDPRRIT
jgi:hypothetical protein